MTPFLFAKSHRRRAILSVPAAFSYAALPSLLFFVKSLLIREVSYSLLVCPGRDAGFLSPPFLSPLSLQISPVLLYSLSHLADDIFQHSFIHQSARNGRFFSGAKKTSLWPPPPPLLACFFFFSYTARTAGQLLPAR